MSCTCIMSGYDGDDKPSFHRITTHKARKQHKCGECGHPILVGERYEKVVGVWDGEFSTQLTCLGCVDVRNTLFCDGWIYGDIWNDLTSDDIITPNQAPSACLLQELSERGANKLKRMWMSMVNSI